MGFYRTAEAHEKAQRERAKREFQEYVLLGYSLLACERLRQQKCEDAWYEKFQQAQAQRKGSE